MNAATKALALITDALDRGETVFISTALRVTKITPATANRWKTSGHVLFRIMPDGCLAMAQGKSWARIVTPSLSLVRITVEGGAL